MAAKADHDTDSDHHSLKLRSIFIRHWMRPGLFSIAHDIQPPGFRTCLAAAGAKSRGAKSSRCRRHVSHSWDVPGDSNRTCFTPSFSNV
jgi:hypothetical protein